jgi:hypothetical protein
MPSAKDPRPPVAVGHVRLMASDVAAAARWCEEVGFRPIFAAPDFAVLELRGGTHLVLRKAEEKPQRGTPAPFDLMVDDIAAAHRDYAAKRLAPGEIEKGRIHDSFPLPGPDGQVFTVVSSHAGDRPV